MHVDFLPLDTVQRTRDAHHDGEQAGPQQIAQGFRNAQPLFREQGGPLGHGLLGGAGTDHEQDGNQKDPGGQQRFQRRPLAFLLLRHQGDMYKFNERDNWQNRPGQRENKPQVLTD